MSPGAVDWRTKTGKGRHFIGEREKGERGSTIFVADGFADCDGGFLVGVLEDHDLGQFYTQPGGTLAVCVVSGVFMGLYRSATSLASWGWLLPVSSFIEFVAMVGVE